MSSVFITNVHPRTLKYTQCELLQCVDDADFEVYWRGQNWLLCGKHSQYIKRIGEWMTLEEQVKELKRIQVRGIP